MSKPRDAHAYFMVDYKQMPCSECSRNGTANYIERVAIKESQPQVVSICIWVRFFQFQSLARTVIFDFIQVVDIETMPMELRRLNVTKACGWYMWVYEETRRGDKSLLYMASPYIWWFIVGYWLHNSFHRVHRKFEAIITTKMVQKTNRYSPRSHIDMCVYHTVVCRMEWAYFHMSKRIFQRDHATKTPRYVAACVARMRWRVSGACNCCRMLVSLNKQHSEVFA